MNTILLVDPNVITRTMLASVLAKEGYRVIEARDGNAALQLVESEHPDLILQEAQLPDMDCAELCRRVRSLPEGAELPIVGLLGFAAREDPVQSAMASFSDFLFKPVAPFELRKTVAAHLAPRLPKRPPPSALLKVLVVDDDPVQLKLSTFRLTDAPYQVETAVNGVEALEKARDVHPDAIVSDVLMPEMDGFRLCQAVRADPELARTPVVLTSSVFVEDADRMLAAEVGANALVTRTPDHKLILDAIAASVPAGLPRLAASTTMAVSQHYTERMILQLERQVGLNARLIRKLAFREVQIGILSTAATVLTRNGTRAEVLDELLRCFIEAAEMSHGAIYLFEDGERIVLGGQCGYEVGDPALQDFFGCEHVLHRAMRSQNAILVPGPSVAEAETHALLTQSGLELMLILPIPGHGGPPGVLCLGSSTKVTDLDAGQFAEALAGQLGQSMALTDAFSRAASAESMYREMFENAAEGIFRLSAQGQILSANPALARTLGYADPTDLLAHVADWTGITIDPLQAALFVQSLGSAATLSGVEVAARRKDGSEALLLASGRAVRNERGAIRCYECVAQDVTEKRRTQQLERIEQEQRAQLEWKDQLLSHVTHELRSPLATLRQFIELVHDGIAGPLKTDQSDYLAIALSNADELSKMISDLVEVSRIQGLKLSMRPQRCRANAVIGDVGASLEPLAVKQGLTLSVDLDPGLPPLHADPRRLRQTLVNLVENSIKFTPSGGEIRIRASLPFPESAFVSISVEDNGRGIEPADQARIFEHFFQAPAATQESRKGLGLGLYLCKQWVTRLGGEIGVESSPGAGSRFTFTVPVFSVARLIGPICTRENLDSKSLYLTEVALSRQTPPFLSARGEAAVDSARESLSGLLRPDLDILLPRLGPTGERETFLVVSFASKEGVEVLSRRIRTQLGKNPELARAGLLAGVSARAIRVPDKTWTIDSVAACVSRDLNELTDPHD